MHGRCCRSYAHRLAQKGRFFGIALDQMDIGARRLRQCAGENHTREAAAAAKVDPDFRRRSQAQKLERISDVSSPEMRKRRWRDEVGLGLPLLQEADVAIQPRLRFT